MKRLLIMPKQVVFILSTFLTLVVVYLVNGYLYTRGLQTVCVSILLPLRVLIISILVGYFYVIRKLPVLFGILIGAAIYLLIEASVLGCVRDYFKFFNLFKFNVSDLLITCSTIGILYNGLKTSASNHKN